MRDVHIRSGLKRDTAELHAQRASVFSGGGPDSFLTHSGTPGLLICVNKPLGLIGCQRFDG